MGVGPGDGIGVFELPVFWIGAIDFEIGAEATGCEVATWVDVVAGEQMDDGRGDGDGFRNAEAAVGIDVSRQGLLDRGQLMGAPRGMLSQTIHGTPSPM